MMYFFYRFLKDTRGSVMTLAAFLMIPALTLTGGGMDVGQVYMVREKLQNVLDSAALHGVTYLGLNSLSSEVQRFIDLSFPSTQPGISLNPVTITEDIPNKTLTLHQTGTLSTSFLHLAGISSLSFAAQAKAQATGATREIVFVLDTTGSMLQDNTAANTFLNCLTTSCNKMQYMKYAVYQFLNALAPSGTLEPNTYIGLVPFTATINIGTSRSSWTTGTAGLDFGTTGWRGCVMARHQNNRDTTDNPPSIQAFTPYRWPSTYGTIYWEDKCVGSKPLVYAGRLVVGDNNWKVGNESDTLAGNKTYMDQAKGSNLNCGNEITPLTNTYSTLKYNLSLLDAFNRGGSMAIMGLGWGYNMLSPNWRGLWGGETPANLPLDYNSSSVEKTMILITDGGNNLSDWTGVNISASTSNQYISEIGQTAWNQISNYWNNGSCFNSMWSGAPGSPVNSTYPDTDYTAYGRLSQNLLGSTNLTTAINTLNTRMVTLCTNIKTSGIKLYIITIGGGFTSTDLSRYTTCATTGCHYDVPNLSNLKTTLESIHLQTTSGAGSARNIK